MQPACCLVMIERKEEKSKWQKRIKVEPPYDAGDCGYYALMTGILYLAILSDNDPELKAVLNSSKLLTEILLKMGEQRSLSSLIIDTNSNLENLKQLIHSMENDNFFEAITFKEILTGFSNAIRESIHESPWGREYFAAVIRSGTWTLDNQSWNKLPPFQKIESKILSRMDKLAEGKTISIEEAGELRFRATLKVCEGLSDEQLDEMAKAVIKTYYASGSGKAWLGREFLDYFSRTMFPETDKLLFDPSGVEITSEGPSSTHWYVDLPLNEASEKLLQAANHGHSKDLKNLGTFTVSSKKSEDLSVKLENWQDLKNNREKQIDEFKKLVGELRDHMVAKNLESPVFSESMIENLSFLMMFEEQPPEGKTIDEAILPIVEKDESVLGNYYTPLIMLGTSIRASNEAIDSLQKEIRRMKEKNSISSIPTTGLFSHPSRESSPSMEDEPHLTENKGIPHP